MLRKLLNVRNTMIWLPVVTASTIFTVVGICVHFFKNRTHTKRGTAAEQTKLHSGELSVRSYLSNFQSLPEVQPETVISNKELQTAYIQENFGTVSTSAKPKIYTVPELKETYRDEVNGIRKVSIGQSVRSVQEKVVLLVGETGTGKTTLINGIFNYILGIEWKDDFRLMLTDKIMEDIDRDEAESQTKWITSYTIHHQPWFTIPFSLTVIDTPGFGDTEGIERDREIEKQIKTLFTRKGLGGLDQLDAIGFVAQASQGRLTPSQLYIFNSILSIFGKDLAQNIFMMLTFADDGTPQILSGIQEANVQYKDYFQFNNSALFGSNDEKKKSSRFNQMFWELGTSMFQKFMEQLKFVQAKSLLLTQEHLKERHELKSIIEGIQRNIQVELNELAHIKMDHQVIKYHEREIDEKKHFTYKTRKQTIESEEVDVNTSTTNCLICKTTCHEECSVSDDSMKINCSVMQNGRCKICPEQCSWKNHRNQSFVYRTKIQNVTQASENLRVKYDMEEDQQQTSEQLAENCVNQFAKRQEKTLQYAEEARVCLERINKIALKPNLLTIVDYLDLLIQDEKKQTKPGWHDRVEQLEEVKKRVKVKQPKRNAICNSCCYILGAIFSAIATCGRAIWTVITRCVAVICREFLCCM